MTGPAGRALVGLALILASAAPAGADAGRGERVFQRCYACHSVVAGEDGLPGPNLRCVLGRRAGTRPGFAFSPAMSEAGVVGGLAWTRATLDAFLADPQRVVPGTDMGMPGLPGADDRRDVIDYLEAAGRCTGGAGPRGGGGASAPARAAGTFRGVAIVTGPERFPPP